MSVRPLHEMEAETQIETEREREMERNDPENKNETQINCKANTSWTRQLNFVSVKKKKQKQKEFILFNYSPATFFFALGVQWSWYVIAVLLCCWFMLLVFFFYFVKVITLHANRSFISWTYKLNSQQRFLFWSIYPLTWYTITVLLNFLKYPVDTDMCFWLNCPLMMQINGYCLYNVLSSMWKIWWTICWLIEIGNLVCVIITRLHFNGIVSISEKRKKLYWCYTIKVSQFHQLLGCFITSYLKANGHA